MKRYKDVKNIKRRVLALTLAVLMVLTVLPVDFTSYAAEAAVATEETGETEASQTVENPSTETESTEDVAREKSGETTAEPTEEEASQEKTSQEEKDTADSQETKEAGEEPVGDTENPEAVNDSQEENKVADAEISQSKEKTEESVKSSDVKTKSDKKSETKKEKTSLFSLIKENLMVAAAGDDLVDLEDVVDTIKLSSTKYTYDASECRPTVTLTGYDGKTISARNYTVTYTNNINAGRATVTITGNESAGYTGELSRNFSIIARDIKSCEMEALASPVIYTQGTEYRPEVTLTYGDYTLVKGKDYQVSYRNYNKVGTETVVVDGIGNFSSSREEYVTLIGDFEKDVEVSIEGEVADYNNDFATEYTTRYTGSVVENPVVEVTLAGKTLVETTDYTVKYDYQADRINVGKVEIQINGAGTYAGKSIIASYEIVPRPLTGCVFTLTGEDNKVYNDGNPITFDTKDVTLTRNGTPLEYGEDKDYVLEYENNTNAGTAKIKAVGCGNYTGSVEKEFTIQRKNIDEYDEIQIIGVSDKQYTGKEITFPDAKVTYLGRNGREEIPATDYTLAYTKNVDIGTATVTAYGQGNLTGSIFTTFEVTPKTFEGLTFTVGGTTITCSASDYDVATQTYVMYSKYTVQYDGTAHEPEVLIKEGSTDLAWKGVTYTIEDNINAGSENGHGLAYVNVSGSAPYTGQKAKVYFEITPKPFDANLILSAIADQVYTGSAVCPEPGVRDGSLSLTKDTDYTLSYENNVNAASKNGTKPPTVTITGIGNYTGSVARTFTIGSDLSGATVTMTSTGATGTDDNFTVPYMGTLRPTFTLASNGALVDPSGYTVTYSPATVANSGNTVQVTCTGTKGYYGSKTFSYTVEKADLTDAIVTNNDTVQEQDFTYVYTDRQIAVNLGVVKNVDGNTVTLTKDVDYIISGSDYSNNEIKGTVGTHTIAITGIGNYQGSQTITYTVEKGKISDTTRYQVAAIEDQPYTGSPIKPTVVMKDAKTDRQLELDKDYEIIGYENNTDIGDGAAIIHLRGINNYEGTRDVKFSIIQRNIEQGNVTIDSIENQIYTGSPITPTNLLNVYYEGNPLASDDYDVTFTNNTNIGYANITITGKNHYKGTRTYTNAFKIVGNLADTSKFTIEGVASSYILNNEGTIDTSAITVKYKDQDTQVDPANYEITKINCSAPGARQIRIDGKNGCYGTITYDISVLCNLDVTDSLISVKNIETGYDYTGGAIRPVPTVTYKDDALQRGVHYELDYANNTEAGTATVRIYAIGTYYTGERTITYNINYNLNSATITGVDKAYVYQGSAIEPQPVVNCKGKVLDKNVHYDVTYTDNDKAGKAKLTITPVGAYVIGSREISFDITKAGLADTTITYDGLSQESIDAKQYIGEEIKPEVQVTYNGTILTAGTDYTVSYANNKNAGEASVTVRGQGNYSGSVTKTFTIEPWDIQTDVTAEISDGYFAGGEEVVPDVQLTYRGKSLAEGTDYTVSCSNNTSVGASARIVITGKNNFTGSLTRSFTIQETNLGTGAVDFDGDTITYTGSTITLNSIKRAMTVTCPVSGGKTHTLTSTEFDITCDRTIQDAGTYTLVLTGKNGFTGTLEIEFVVEAKDIGTDGFTIDAISNQTYTAQAVTPEVYLRDAGKLLAKDADYSVQYADNIDAGKATVIVTGQGNYTGTREIYFYIGESIEGKCSISLKQGSIIYNGTQQTPEINTVTYDGSTPLIQGLDYVIASTDEAGNLYDYTNAGDKVLHIKGSGKYYGESTIIYTIAKKVAQADKISVSLDMGRGVGGDYEAVYTGDSIQPQVVVYDQEISASRPLDPADYTVEYVNNTNVGTADVRVKLTRNYVSGTEKLLQFKISKKSLQGYEISLNMNRLHYTGAAIKPTVTVRDSQGAKLAEREYTVSYQNNVNAGLATVVVTASDAGNFSGQLSQTFAIYASLSDKQDTTIEGIGPQFYIEGMEEPRPVPVITCGGNRLVIGEDVEVTYNYVDGDTSKGSVSIVSMKNDYYLDSVTLEYTIGVDPSVLQVSGYADEYTYNGQAVKPNFVVTTPTGQVLSYDASEVVYRNKTDAGTIVGDTTSAGTVTAVIPVTAGSQKINVTITFVILKKQVTACRTVQLINNTYTGKELTPPVAILYNNKQLVSGRDYTVTYKDNKNPGVASVIITGRGNYAGTTTLHFNILAANVFKLKASATTTSSIKLNWSKGSKVTGYQIYSSDGKKKYGTTSGSSYTVKKLKAGTGYKFMVRSYVKVGGKTTYGQFQSVSTCTKVAKVKVSGKSSSKKKIKLSWNKNQTVGGYEIYRADSKNRKYKKIASVPSSKTSYTDKKRKSGKTYYYKIRAYKKSNGKYLYGSFSSVVKVKAK